MRVQRLEDVLEVCPTILTEDGMQAQHLGAVLALYTMVKGQVTAGTLTPPYIHYREVPLSLNNPCTMLYVGSFLLPYHSPLLSLLFFYSSV